MAKQYVDVLWMNDDSCGLLNFLKKTNKICDIKVVLSSLKVDTESSK